MRTFTKENVLRSAIGTVSIENELLREKIARLEARRTQRCEVTIRSRTVAPFQHKTL